MAVNNNTNYRLGFAYVLLGICLLVGFAPWQLLGPATTELPIISALVLACNLLIQLAVVAAILRATVREPTDSRRRTWGTLLATLTLDFAAMCSFIVARSGGDSIAEPIISPLGDSLQISAYVMVVVALRSMRAGTQETPDWRLPTLDTYNGIGIKFTDMAFGHQSSDSRRERWFTQLHPTVGISITRYRDDGLARIGTHTPQLGRERQDASGYRCLYRCYIRR